LYAEVADRWKRWGHPLERGLALLGAGRCQLAAGATPQAAARLEEARIVFAGLGAHTLAGEAEAVQARAASRA
jgi:hypothetical protein